MVGICSGTESAMFTIFFYLDLGTVVRWSHSEEVQRPQSYSRSHIHTLPACSHDRRHPFQRPVIDVHPLLPTKQSGNRHLQGVNDSALLRPPALCSNTNLLSSLTDERHHDGMVVAHLPSSLAVSKKAAVSNALDGPSHLVKTLSGRTFCASEMDFPNPATSAPAGTFQIPEKWNLASAGANGVSCRRNLSKWKYCPVRLGDGSSPCFRSCRLVTLMSL